jgi:hypothetical protein
MTSAPLRTPLTALRTVGGFKLVALADGFTALPGVCDVCQLTGVEAGGELGLAQILVVARRLSGSDHELALTIG